MIPSPNLIVYLLYVVEEKKFTCIPYFLYKVVRWSGGQVVRWSGGKVGRWAGGKVGRWAGGQVVSKYKGNNQKRTH